MQRIFAVFFALLFTLPAVAGELAAPDALALARAGKLTIVDVRTPVEWNDTGIAPGARTANFLDPAGAAAFVANVLKAAGGNKAAPLGIVCRSGNRSTKAVALLEKAGFANLHHIGEGMNGWLARGLPTVAAP